MALRFGHGRRRRFPCRVVPCYQRADQDRLRKALEDCRIARSSPRFAGIKPEQMDGIAPSTSRRFLWARVELNHQPHAYQVYFRWRELRQETVQVQSGLHDPPSCPCDLSTWTRPKRSKKTDYRQITAARESGVVAFPRPLALLGDHATRTPNAGWTTHPASRSSPSTPSATATNILMRKFPSSAASPGRIALRAAALYCLVPDSHRMREAMNCLLKRTAHAKDDLVGRRPLRHLREQG